MPCASAMITAIRVAETGAVADRGAVRPGVEGLGVVEIEVALLDAVDLAAGSGSPMIRLETGRCKPYNDREFV